MTVITTFTLQRRGHDKVSTWGELRDGRDRLIATILERGPAPMDHPCIPAGRYPLIHKPGGSRFDARYKARFPRWYRNMVEVSQVPGRTAILIHTANRYTDLLGCLGTGKVTPGIAETPNGYQIPPGTSMPAFEEIYPLFYKAIDGGEAWLDVKDVPK
jgi:hypothetical protein